MMAAAVFPGKRLTSRNRVWTMFREGAVSWSTSCASVSTAPPRPVLAARRPSRGRAAFGSTQVSRPVRVSSRSAVDLSARGICRLSARPAWRRVAEGARVGDAAPTPALSEDGSPRATGPARYGGVGLLSYLRAAVRLRWRP